MRTIELGFMAAAVLFGLACGGKVVVDASNSDGGVGDIGGAGGAVASTGDKNPVEGTTTSSVVSSSTGGATLCEQFCSVAATSPCESWPDCKKECEIAAAGAGPCEPAFKDLLTCVINSETPSCDFEKACSGYASVVANCAPSSSCADTSVGFSSTRGPCDAQGFCKGALLEQQCTPGDATNFCTCFKNGTLIGKCNEPLSTGVLSCDLVKGCCAQQFFP